MNNDRERRFTAIASAEVRINRSGASPKLEGYSAVFNSLSEDLGGFREKIEPGFFARALASADCRCLFNHDPSMILGRNVAGTLRMSEDSTGLNFECDLPDTTLGRDITVSIERRDVTGCSFTFLADVDQWDYSGETIIRTLVECKSLFDVGPVVYPAYTATSVSARSLQAALAKPADFPPFLVNLAEVELDLRDRLGRLR